MRFRHQIIACAVAIACGIPSSASAAVYENTDMPGGDYASFKLNGSSENCSYKCYNDPKCKAWTFVKPGFQGQSAVCWLKSTVPARRANKCCTSGTEGKID